jgi:hypothetical protein
MSFDVEKLYSLLPAIYRIRDIELAETLEGLLVPKEAAELNQLQSLSTLTARQARRLAELVDKRQRGPLKALLSVIAEQASVLEENLDQLYDDLFIETCAEWVVPYIGDLIGVRGVTAFPGANFTERAFVANAMASRRRKGTAAILEELARDVTNWPASVVEYFQLLATTQYLNHLRPENLSVANLHDSESLEFIGTPFDRVARTVDVRRIETGRGKYNIPNIGIFLWRLTDYSITDAPVYRFDDRRYLFDVLGKDTQLYNRAEPEDQITHLAEPINVPMPFTRRFLKRRLDAYYGLDAKGKVRSILLSERDPLPPHKLVPIAFNRIKICDLSDLRDKNGNVITVSGKAIWAHLPTDKIAIDPVLGRIAFPVTSPPTPPPQNLRATYHYGFSADMGGGEYERVETFIGEGTIVKVPKDQPAIQLALDQIAASGGIVEIQNNDRFFETPKISAGTIKGSKIEFRAAAGRRPAIVLPPPASGDILITGGGTGSEVTINGLLIGGGRLRVPKNDTKGNPNKLERLRLRHCTLAPGTIAEMNFPDLSPPLTIGAQSPAPRLLVELPNLIVEIDSCIVGPIRAVAGAEVHITNSIVDASASTEIAFADPSDGAGAPLKIENSTIIGKVFTETMTLASNTIFLADLSAGDPWRAAVRAERLQEGCVRFSFVPRGSQLPRLHRCQPENDADAARLRPIFTSLRYGDAAYCQLSATCAVEITGGADDQAEMGAFHNLYQPRREANLRAALDEYLRFGLEAGIFYAS